MIRVLRFECSYPETDLISEDAEFCTCSAIVDQSTQGTAFRYLLPATPFFFEPPIDVNKTGCKSTAVTATDVPNTTAVVLRVLTSRKM